MILFPTTNCKKSTERSASDDVLTAGLCYSSSTYQCSFVLLLCSKFISSVPEKICISTLSMSLIIIHHSQNKTIDINCKPKNKRQNNSVLENTQTRSQQYPNNQRSFVSNFRHSLLTKE